MPIYIQRILPHANGHRTAIFTTHRPNWFQWLFLFMRRKEVCYMGRGTKWVNWHTQKPVKKYIARQLQVEEQLYKQTKRSKRK